jgi:hypothetical protein
MAVKIDRRAFVGAGLAAAALPSLSRGQGSEPESRRIIDAVTGQGLGGIKVLVKKVGSQGRWGLRTDSEGNYRFDKITSILDQPTLCRVRISPKQLHLSHLGFEGYWTLNPGLGMNSGVGDIGLIPLSSSSLPFDLGATAEIEFRERWLRLLRELFLSIDCSPDSRPKQTAEGALVRCAAREMLTVRVSDELLPSEYSFVRSSVGPALQILAKHLFAKIRFVKVAAADTSLEESELPVGTVTVTKREDFPRPAVRIRYGNTNPYDVDANPNEILASQIILDTYTLDELYRQGQGSSANKALAQSLLKRCTAYALGWRPTLMLPNATVVDDNYGPPGMYTRTSITSTDKALHAAISGGGSGCYAPGIRLASSGLPRLIADPAFPLTPTLTP